MRKRIKPVVLLVFLSVSFLFSFFHERLPICKPESDKKQPKRFRTPIHLENNHCKLFFSKEEDINPELVGRPIIDISGWQLPSEIDYDVLSQNVGGVIVRVHSGAQAKKENAATYLNGLDKSFKTHIQEFQNEISLSQSMLMSLLRIKKKWKKKQKNFTRLLLLTNRPTIG